MQDAEASSKAAAGSKEAKTDGMRWRGRKGNLPYRQRETGLRQCLR